VGLIRAIYEYVAQEDNEVPFAEGDLLTLLDRLDEDWWLVRNSAGQYGLVPSNYVQDANATENEGDDDGSENIFKVPKPVPMHANAELKTLFPNVEAKKKWSAELHIEKKVKVKGKLLVLENGIVVFVHGKEKVKLWRVTDLL
jgi:hypothetical protein